MQVVCQPIHHKRLSDEKRKIVGKILQHTSTAIVNNALWLWAQISEQQVQTFTPA